MTDVYTFNTGREYTEQGQIISYYHTAENTTVMADRSRGICYEFEGHLDERGLMFHYDRNEGEPSLRALRFLQQGTVEEAQI